MTLQQHKQQLLDDYMLVLSGMYSRKQPLINKIKRANKQTLACCYVELEQRVDDSIGKSYDTEHYNAIKADYLKILQGV